MSSIRKVRATVHGAISIVNAIATGNGSSLGISLRVIAEVEFAKGRGIRFLTGKWDDNLVRNIVLNSLPKEFIENNRILVKAKTEIPIGYGLKSSSAFSNAVALACSRLIVEDIDDITVLDAAVRASLHGLMLKPQSLWKRDGTSATDQGQKRSVSTESSDAGDGRSRR